MLSNIGASIGKIFRIPHFDMPMSLAPNSIIVKFHDEETYDYFECMFKSFVGQDFLLKLTAGTAMPKFSKTELKQMFVPIAPLKEHVRISEECYKLLSVVDSMESNIVFLSEIIDLTKSKVLDLAIRGKLISQDPNDEPASVLLERIRSEKEELIKQGKLKHDKKESIIYKGDDNSYLENINGNINEINTYDTYSLPNGWEFVRLKNICTKIIDGAHNPPKGLSTKTEYIMASSRNINNNCLYDMGNVRFLSAEDYSKENTRTNLENGDLLLTTVGTLGRSCIYEGVPEKITFQRSVSIITTLIEPLYLKTFFDSPLFQSLINHEATGTAQKGFYLNQLEDVIIPIPPLIEQRQLASMVNKYENVFSTIVAYIQ